jgi:hypothetical protein
MMTLSRKWNLKNDVNTEHIWMGDTGASCHFTKDDTSMFQWRKIHEKIGLLLLKKVQFK